MKIGMMNHPERPAVEQAKWAADNGFDFLDLTVEGPGAAVDQIDADELRRVLDGAGMTAVGHTSWMLPFATPFPQVRAAAVESFCETLPLFRTVGVEWVNVHASKTPGKFSRRDSLAWQAEAFATLAVRAAEYGLRVMVEHPPQREIGPAEMETLLAGDARLGLHLDFGHLHVGTPDGLRLTREFVAHFAPRLAHAHLSDNKLKADDHLPLGAGNVKWRDCLQVVRDAGYDRTLTLEVFSPDPALLLHSVRQVREFLGEGG